MITECKHKEENIKASRQCWSRENSAYFESTNTVSRKKCLYTYFLVKHAVANQCDAQRTIGELREEKNAWIGAAERTRNSARSVVAHGTCCVVRSPMFIPAISSS